MKEEMKKTFLIFYFIALTFSSFAMENKSYEIKGQAWNKLNINKQQKAEILAIQENFKTSMKKINLNSAEKINYLEELLEQEASNEKLQDVISEIANLKAEQMWLIIKNKRSINNILGKTKTQEMMNLARKHYNERKEKYGDSWPPIPNTPPLPNY